ncbi:MAG: formylglycine-generating enzyme family protein [Gemmataceae bacterium]
MSQFDSLLNAIPDNPKTAFILSDYLEEQGDPRCDMLRLSYTLKDVLEITPERLAKEERLRELILVEGLEPVVPTYTNEIGMEFVWIPPGKFLMGSPEDETERGDNETQHEVTLTKGFWLQRTAVTQSQWEQVMGDNPSEFQDPELPVELVSWFDCEEFCQKLSERTSRKTVLPSEAQLEYACRAGTTTPFWFGTTISTKQVNYEGDESENGADEEESKGPTVHVRSFRPNGWGLYQMHGNVWEWCQTWHENYTQEPRVDPVGPTKGDFRIYRGGSWAYNAASCRSGYREGCDPDLSNDDLGLRCVLAPE